MTKEYSIAEPAPLLPFTILETVPSSYRRESRGSFYSVSVDFGTRDLKIGQE